jgi:hypothetical protein
MDSMSNRSQLNRSLHGTTKHKKFFSLVFHNLITKILNQVRNVDWSIVIACSWYLDFVFVFVAEEHLQASTEDVSWGRKNRQEVLRKLHSNIQSIFLIVLHGHFFPLLTQAVGDCKVLADIGILASTRMTHPPLYFTQLHGEF